MVADFTVSPLRCTQNPSMGEEWRRGWHPERMPPRASDAKVLVVGGGPAGLEAAQALGKRGHEVILVDASRDLGGRVAKEARLPGLAAWIRVVDYRLDQIERLANVEEARGTVTAREVLDYDFDHVAVATGARWRADGVGRFHTRPIPRDPALPVLTPDDVMEGERPAGERVLIYDDDHYYMGGVLAELLRAEGYAVTLVTPGLCASSWTVNTMEQHRIQARLLELGVEIEVSRAVTATMAGGVSDRLRVHRGRARARLRRGADGHRPAPRGLALPRSARVPRRVGGRGAAHGQGGRRLLVSGDDRRRRLGGPPLRAGARRPATPARTTRCCAR